MLHGRDSRRHFESNPETRAAFARRANQQFRVQPPRKKYFASPPGRLSSIRDSFRPERGAYRDRHGRGMECGGRGSAGRASLMAGRVSRERSTRAGRTALLTFATASTDWHIAGRNLWRRRCVRQNRVVLAPVAGVKLAEARSAQPGLIAINPQATVTKRIRRRGEHGISRKTIAQGMPACSDCTCMLVCVSFMHFAHETAGAASTRRSLRPPLLGAKVFSHDLGASRRGIRKARLRFENRHCEERSDEESTLSLPTDGLLRFARNDGQRGRANAPPCPPAAIAAR
jgi:hypothetical protein